MSATMTFDDEFNSLSLWNGSSGTWQPVYDWSPNGNLGSDSTSWLVNPNWGPTSSPEANPYSDNNGVLSINLMPTPGSVSPSAVNNAPFLAGQLETKHSFSQTYGYFEMRAQMPAGAGLNSAFWLLPESGAWPPELDVEEIVSGDPTTLVNTAHTGSGNSANPMWSNIPDSSQGYHTYAVDWEPNTITWYFDGKQVAQQATPADMHQPMYVLVDTMAGTSGSWEGAPTPGEHASMNIDYVRAYSSNPYANGGTPPAPTDTTSSANTPAGSTSNSSTSPASASGTSSPDTSSSGTSTSTAPGTSPAPDTTATSNGATTNTAGNTSSSTVSADQLTVTLSEDAYQGDAQFIVKMDGTQLGSAQSVTASNADGKTQDFTFSGNWGAGTHNVEIDFINDAYAGPGQDRNLTIDQVTYDGVAAMSQPSTLWSNGGVTIAAHS